MAISKVKYKPFVVEQGTYGSWTYRKWSDGTAECWCRKPNVTFSTTSAYGGVYYGTAFSFDSFPQGLFIDDSLVIGIELAGGDGCWAGINTITATSFSFYPYCAKSGNHTCTISVSAIGKWK